MSRMSERILQSMSDAEFVAAAQRAEVLNEDANARLKLRADHIRAGGILCYQCANPVPRATERDFLAVLSNGQEKPLCGAECAAQRLHEQMRLSLYGGVQVYTVPGRCR